MTTGKTCALCATNTYDDDDGDDREFGFSSTITDKNEIETPCEDQSAHSNLR